MTIISKLEAAHRQIATAIKLYFDDDDVAAIHTLACASREIYEKQCEHEGLERLFSLIESANSDRSRKELWDILNGPRNFLKHPDSNRDLSAQLELDDEMNATMIFYACHDCAILCKNKSPPEVDAFSLWYIQTRFPLDFVEEVIEPENQAKEEARLRAVEGYRAVERNYPGLRSAKLSKQKQIGKQMVKDARNIHDSLCP